MEKILLFLNTDNTIVLIAVGLGIFFLCAAFIKGIRTRRHRQLRESSAQAAANGGTAEAPVHIGGNPYEIVQPPAADNPPLDLSAPASPPASAPADVTAPPPSAQPTAASAPANEPDENPNAYVWE